MKKEKLDKYVQEFTAWLEKDKPEIHNIKESFKSYLKSAFSLGVIEGTEKMYDNFLTSLEKVKKDR